MLSPGMAGRSNRNCAPSPSGKQLNRIKWGYYKRITKRNILEQKSNQGGPVSHMTPDTAPHPDFVTTSICSSCFGQMVVRVWHRHPTRIPTNPYTPCYQQGTEQLIVVIHNRRVVCLYGIVWISSNICGTLWRGVFACKILQLQKKNWGTFHPEVFSPSVELMARWFAACCFVRSCPTGYSGLFYAWLICLLTLLRGNVFRRFVMGAEEYREWKSDISRDTCKIRTFVWKQSHNPDIGKRHQRQLHGPGPAPQMTTE